MTPTVNVDKITIDKDLYDFVTNEAIPGTGVDAKAFWSGFANLVTEMAPRNAALLRRRDELQSQN